MLDPAKVATEGLSGSNINLLIGEGILKFLLNECHEAKDRHRSSYLAEEVLKSFEKRFEERRNPIINTLVLYLSNRDIQKNDHPLQLSSKVAAIKCGIEMMKRLFANEHTLTVNDSIQEEKSQSSSIYERLVMSVGSVKEGNLSRDKTATVDPFKKAFELYDRQHVRGPELNKLFDALLSIQPTSTQSERNFSLAAAVCTPKRSRLDSDKLNSICFLKSYFLNQLN